MREGFSRIIDDVVHELRRALRGPIFHIYRGELGPLHDFAIEHGWLGPSRHGEAYLALTDRGLRFLADDQNRRGLH